MQDDYVGDIGDYGKYGLLRKANAAGLSLSVNWYRTIKDKNSKQNDGKYTNYLQQANNYRHYDPELFDALYKIVELDKDRTLERIEKSNLLSARFFSEFMNPNRQFWHIKAFEETKNSDVVFLDPDNGLESKRMFEQAEATFKHVKWLELRDYYERGQSVILYQHRPQMMKTEQCIQNILTFNQIFLKDSLVKMLEFPQYTNRFYFMFIQNEHAKTFEQICIDMRNDWQKICK